MTVSFVQIVFDSLIVSAPSFALNNYGLTVSPDIAYEGVSYNRPEDGQTMFLEAFLIPNIEKYTDLKASKKTAYGLYQVNCWGPKGRGMGNLRLLAQVVIDLFGFNPDLTIVFDQAPVQGRPITDDPNWIAIPVTIPYRYEY